MENPLDKFQQWWREATINSPLKQKSAVCVSTIDEEGFPSARFVDLKAVDEAGFVFCTYLDSTKGKHILRNPKTAITAWWDHVGYQVRITGVAEPIEEAEAVRYWRTRSRSAQLTTTAFEQSQTLAAEGELSSKVQALALQLQGTEIAKPGNWGEYRVKPATIEFLTFRDSRLHLRELYKLRDDAWTKSLLQP